MSSLGKRLRTARERKKLKQTQVMEKTGVNNKTLSGYENEVSEPDFETLKALASLYDVSTDWLLGKEMKKEKESAFALPESDYELIIKEAENHFNVELHDDPVVLAAVRQMVRMLAEAKAKEKQ